MTQSQTYRSNVADFEPNRWNGPFAFLIYSLGLCAVAAIAFYAGMEFDASLVREAARIEAAKPKRADNKVNPPAALIDCTPHGAQEYRRACAARWRAGRVGQ